MRHGKQYCQTVLRQKLSQNRSSQSELFKLPCLAYSSSVMMAKHLRVGLLIVACVLITFTLMMSPGADARLSKKVIVAIVLPVTNDFDYSRLPKRGKPPS